MISRFFIIVIFKHTSTCTLLYTIATQCKDISQYIAADTCTCTVYIVACYTQSRHKPSQSRATVATTDAKICHKLSN